MNAQQLKNSILQEAIEGRLVPQNPNDEPASVLLDKIRAEKKRLAKEGKLKKKDLEETPINEDEIPFKIPKSWKWQRMQDVIEFVNGRAYKREELLDSGKYKVLRVGNFFTNDSWYYSDLELTDDKYCYKGDLLYAWSASFGPKIWEEDKTIFHYHIWNVKYDKRIFYREYLYYFFLIDKVNIKSSTTGSTMVHVSMENMKPRLIPIPPLAEQKRIVEKIEDLLPKVEVYGKAQESLDKLNEELPEQLKKCILQEAIEGRLVPQDSNDEPASVLLDKIRAEKRQLVKEGKLKKKDLEETPISEDEIPFEIPESWEWVRLVDIGIAETGTTPSKSHPEYFGTFIPFLGPANMLNGQIISETQGLSEIGADYGRIVPKGSILQVCIGGSIGKCAIVDKPVTFNQQINSITPLVCVIEFIYYVLQSDYFRLAIKDKSTGTATPIINRGNWEQLAIPLPPLAEQKRIVGKIEQLMKEIDKLK